VSVSDLLDGKRVCVCGGSGGVGKTTTSAAVALGMAAEGAKVAVVTIDPARRLANALGRRDREVRDLLGRAVGDDA
jgi:anion-transporting  ArsA/GET3 family ATPase